MTRRPRVGVQEDIGAGAHPYLLTRLGQLGESPAGYSAARGRPLGRRLYQGTS